MAWPAVGAVFPVSGAAPGMVFALGVRCEVVLGLWPGGKPFGVPAAGVPLVTADDSAGSGLPGV